MCNYISKAEAINTILGDMQNGESNMEEIFNTALRKAASRIETIPAADVAPVVHGRWVAWFPGDMALMRTGEEMLWECSHCTAKYAEM